MKSCSASVQQKIHRWNMWSPSNKAYMDMKNNYLLLRATIYVQKAHVSSTVLVTFHALSLILTAALQTALLFLFYRGENWLSEKLNKLDKVTKLGWRRIHDLNPGSFTLRLSFSVPPNIALKTCYNWILFPEEVSIHLNRGTCSCSLLFWIPMCELFGNTVA